MEESYVRLKKMPNVYIDLVTRDERETMRREQVWHICIVSVYELGTGIW